MMAEDGFGRLGSQLIALFHTGTPDCEAAEELIRQGADLNEAAQNGDENILSEILCGYWSSAYDDPLSDDRDDCMEECGEDCEHRRHLNLNPGPAMCSIIRFFLDHGFDVTKQDGCFGAQCLSALTLSTFDRAMIKATKILLDAGARNRPVMPVSGDDGCTPWDNMALEADILEICNHDDATASIFEAVCRIYQAVENGQPYGGIDSWEAAVGRTILRVLADRHPERPDAVPMLLPGNRMEHGGAYTLHFVHDGGVLTVAEGAHFWTNTVLPEVAGLEDVSADFDGAAGSAIERFLFDHSPDGQPCITIALESGRAIGFPPQMGEDNKENGRFVWNSCSEPFGCPALWSGSSL